MWLSGPVLHRDRHRRLLPRAHSHRPTVFGGLLVATFLCVVAPVHLSVTNASVSASSVSTGAFHRLQRNVEPAIVIGGILLERSRHTIAGAAMGCVSGAAMGAMTALGAGAVSGGVAIVGLPVAAALGCGIGGAIGMSMGSPLDQYKSSL